MTTPLSATQAMAREKPDAQHRARHDGVTAWRRGDNATTLLKRPAKALSQARGENSEQSVAR